MAAGSPPKRYKMRYATLSTENEVIPLLNTISLMVLCIYVYSRVDPLYDIFICYQDGLCYPYTKGFEYVGWLEFDISHWLMGKKGNSSITELVHRGDKMRLAMACCCLLFLESIA